MTGGGLRVTNLIHGGLQGMGGEGNGRIPPFRFPLIPPESHHTPTDAPTEQILSRISARLMRYEHSTAPTCNFNQPRLVSKIQRPLLGMQKTVDRKAGLLGISSFFVTRNGSSADNLKGRSA